MCATQLSAEMAAMFQAMHWDVVKPSQMIQPPEPLLTRLYVSQQQEAKAWPQPFNEVYACTFFI